MKPAKDNSPTVIESELLALLRSLDTSKAIAPGTLLYNEGWLLRLALSAAARGVPCLPFSFVSGSRWFSEALLCSAFLPRFRGDRLAEQYTHADAAIGDFNFRDTKSGLVLGAQCRQFVVCEAKIFSPLSAGTKRAPSYNQAARNVGCMAETLRRNGRPLDTYQHVSFCVFAPGAQISAGTFAEQVAKANISDRLAERVESYRGEREFPRLGEWLKEWAFPLLEKIDLVCCDWESVIQQIASTDRNLGEALQRFYDSCLKYNAPVR